MRISLETAYCDPSRYFSQPKASFLSSGSIPMLAIVVKNIHHMLSKCLTVGKIGESFWNALWSYLQLDRQFNMLWTLNYCWKDDWFDLLWIWSCILMWILNIHHSVAPTQVSAQKLLQKHNGVFDGCHHIVVQIVDMTWMVTHGDKILPSYQLKNMSYQACKQFSWRV